MDSGSRLADQICCELLHRLRFLGGPLEGATASGCTTVGAPSLQGEGRAPPPRSISIFCYSVSKAFPVFLRGPHLDISRRALQGGGPPVGPPPEERAPQWELLALLTREAARGVPLFGHPELANASYAVATFAQAAREAGAPPKAGGGPPGGPPKDGKGAPNAYLQ